MPQFQRADAAQADQILEATYEHWNDGLTPQAYRTWWTAQTRTAWGRDHLRRYVLVEGVEVVASAKLYDLSATIDGRPVRVAGIGAIFTPPALRGRGLAAELVEAMAGVLADEGFELALLFSEIGSAYYSRLGFVPVPAHESVLRVAYKPGAPATMVRGGDERDLVPMAGLGTARAEGFRFHLDRSVDLVQYAITKKRLLAGLGPVGARELQFFIAEEGTSAVAYVVLSVKDHLWTLEECGDRDPTGARVGAILQVLLARDPGRVPPVVRGWLPPGFCPPQVTIVSELDAGEVMMVRGLGGYEPPALGRDDVLYWHGDVF